MSSKLTSSEKIALKNAFYNASGSCSGKILNILWQELPQAAKASIEKIINSGITVELPFALTDEEAIRLQRIMDDMKMR